MARKKKTLFAAAAAFAASPQGRQLLQQAKEYAARPETRQRAQELLSQARTRVKAGRTGAPTYRTPPTSSSGT
jgi:hypothetical protein